jgi:hypothetical protein
MLCRLTESMYVYSTNTVCYVSTMRSGQVNPMLPVHGLSRFTLRVGMLPSFLFYDQEIL